MPVGTFENGLRSKRIIAWSCAQMQEIIKLKEDTWMWLGSDGIWRFKEPHVTKDISLQAYQSLTQSLVSSLRNHIQQIAPDCQDTQSCQASGNLQVGRGQQ